tara:strand:- start:22006 stop:22242 length:237 start_codon:yes stop_codon:yes gene_type:complete
VLCSALDVYKEVIMTGDDPTLYDIVRYLGRRLQLATSFKLAGHSTGLAEEVGPLQLAFDALVPLIESEEASMQGGSEE